MDNISGTLRNDEIGRWKVAMRTAIVALENVFEERFGYPIDPGENCIVDAESASTKFGGGTDFLPSVLAMFYADVAEVSLPDVHIGYFLHPVVAIVESETRSLPRWVDAASVRGEVITFGSDGGGGLFSILLQDGAVYYLPGGMVEAGVYKEGLGVPRRIAVNFSVFLDGLLSRVQEFAQSGSCHDFQVGAKVSMSNAGQVVRWFRDLLCQVADLASTAVGIEEIQLHLSRMVEIMEGDPEGQENWGE